MISYTVELSGPAEIDVHVATIWYESRSTQLASKFIDKLTLAFKNISINPFAFSKLTAKSKYRKYKAPGFPYMIYYYISNSRVEVMAIVHTRRSNRYIKRRLK